MRGVPEGRETPPVVFYAPANPLGCTPGFWIDRLPVAGSGHGAPTETRGHLPRS